MIITSRGQYLASQARSGNFQKLLFEEEGMGGDGAASVNDTPYRRSRNNGTKRASVLYLNPPFFTEIDAVTEPAPIESTQERRPWHGRLWDRLRRPAQEAVLPRLGPRPLNGKAGDCLEREPL